MWLDNWSTTKKLSKKRHIKNYSYNKPCIWIEIRPSEVFMIQKLDKPPKKVYLYRSMFQSKVYEKIKLS